MAKPLCYRAGTGAACSWAQRVLEAHGMEFIGHISPEITHLLLDVPSFGPDGQLKGGGRPETLLHMLPSGLTVIGGMLEHPALAGYPVMDLLSDPAYLAQNAYITAECALEIAAPLLPTTFRDTPALVVGWGRIGKCLTHLLRAAGCPVTVIARKEADRAMLEALGCPSQAPGVLPPGLGVIFNTAPEMVLTEDMLRPCGECVKIDLASRRGIAGEDVIWARGLPGVHAPKSSGKLIADTILRRLKEETS